jgi:hypothetical protein
LRCGRCGNENDEINRFCGMCGAALVANDRAGEKAAGQALSPAESRSDRASVSTREERRPAEVYTSDAKSDAWPSTRPVISGGPSLLGLNIPASDIDSRRAGGGHDPLRPSSNVDYLLEDEEEPRRGWGKLILVVVALVLAAGFGYVRWKQGGFDWLNARDKKPTAATTQTPDAAQSGDSGAATGTAAPAGGAAPQAGSGMPPATGSAASPAGSTAAETIPPQTSSQPTPSPSAPAGTTAPPSTVEQSAPQNASGDSSAPAESGSQAASSDSDKQSAPAAANPPQRARKPTAAKPVAALAVDSVTDAERYIYGRGVARDCDRGLRLLKPAAGQSNVKAMISLGALYSTGTCTPRDLPTAYRWFALALHKEPENQALQDDLQKLWSQMTQPERQLAIKLSQ